MRAVLLLVVLLGGSQALSILSAALQKLGSSADQHLQTRWRRSTAPIEPTITRNPAAAEVQEGTQVTFTCRSPSPDVTSYTFKKDVMNCDSRPCSIVSSSHFEGQSSSSFFSVNAAFISAFDAEYKYYCIARNSFGDSVRSVDNTLIVREQPVVIGVVSDNTSPTQGSSTSLECKTDDSINTVIKYYRWEKDGQEMIGESSQFVTATASGEYSCQAFNSAHIKSDKSPAQRISVQDLPNAPTLTATDLTSEIVKEDELVSFQCSSGENVGAEDYRWYQMVAPMPHPTAEITSWLPIQGVRKYTYERSNTNLLQNFPGSDPVAYVYIACAIMKDGLESPKSSYVRYIVRDETKTPDLTSVPAPHGSCPGKLGVEIGTEVELTCGNQGMAGTIRYDFFQDDKLIQSGRHEIFDITEEMSNTASGIYTCDATRNRLPSGESNSLEIEFVEKPSQPEIIETANIPSHRTLSCEISPDTEITKYYWVKNMYDNQQYTSDVSIPTNTMKTLNVPVAEKALYRCKACEVVHCVEICSDYSFNYAFEVPEGPQPSMPTMTSDPLNDKPINEGTTLELFCEVNPIDDVLFKGVIFYRDDGSQVTEIERIKKDDMTGPKNLKAKHEIKSAKLGDAGSYTCKTWSQQGVSDPSQPPLVFQVEGIVTGATLQRDPPQGPVVTGTVVTLTCNGKGQPKSYSFFKEIEITPGFKELDLIQNGASNKLIWAPTPEESGLYSCQPISDKKDIVYDMSNEVNLDITEKPEPPLEVEAKVTLDFDPGFDLSNKISDNYRNLKSDVTKALNDKAKSVSQYLSVEITDMKKGSLIVTFVVKADSAGGNPEASISRFFNTIGSGWDDVNVMGQMICSLGVTTQTPTPTIWSQPSSTYMRSGTTIKFFCQSQTVVPNQIYNFYRDNDLVASNSNGVLTTVGTPAESGHYSCSVDFNRQPSIPSIPVERVFIDPSPKPVITANDENDIQSGTRLVLTCTVTPFPPQPALMSYEWFVMNGNLRKDIPSKTQELTLDNVQPGNSGKYQCRAIIRGSVSSLASAPYQVVVLDPPSKPTISGNPANPVTAGSNVQLTCSATATPGPITGYSWYLDGLQLAESTKFLTVSNVQSSGSSDKYTCRAFVGQPAGKVKSPLSDDYQITVSPTPSPDAGGNGGSSSGGSSSGGSSSGSSGGNGGSSGGQAKPNKPMLMRWPDKTDIPTGTTCYLICLAQTSPGATVTYSFYFNDKVVSTSASTAYVMEGSPAKSGYYTCQVHEDSVSSDKSEAKIMVFADPNQAPVPPPAPSDVIPDAPSPPSTGTDTETETNTDTETETDNASVESDDTWELSLKTSKAWYSGTNANILIELYGSEGTSEIIDVGDVRKGRGDSDIVQFTTSNIGELEYVGIAHDGEKTKSNWKLEQFYVKNVDDASNMISGNPDTWILAEEQLVCDSDDCQIVKGSVDEWTDSWEINIQTSSGHRKAGTSSRVYVQLSGTEGSTAMVRLDQASGKFSKGGDDTFSIKTQAVGDLDTVTFTLDDRGDNWKIWKFTVTNTGTGAVFEADPNDWLDNGQSLECSASGCNIISEKR